MEVCHKDPITGGPTQNQWDEDIPDRLNANGAPDIEGKDAFTRADLTVRWFNDTLRPHEKERLLLAVLRVEEIEVWRLGTND